MAASAPGRGAAGAWRSRKKPEAVAPFHSSASGSRAPDEGTSPQPSSAYADIMPMMTTRPPGFKALTAASNVDPPTLSHAASTPPGATFFSSVARSVAL